jgi:hypothetical protein
MALLDLPLRQTVASSQVSRCLPLWDSDVPTHGKADVAGRDACGIALDGVSGAIRTVLTTVIVTNLTTGTGRFNAARGAVGLLISVAGSASTLIFAYIAQEVGRWTAFLSMAACATAGGLVVWLLLAETKPAKYID